MLGVPPMMGGFRALLVPPITDWWNSVVLNVQSRDAESIPIRWCAGMHKTKALYITLFTH